MEYRCPYCAAPLTRFAVWRSGPMSRSRCPSCRQEFYAGGGVMALLIANTGALLGSQAHQRYELGYGVWALVALTGIGLGLACLFYSQPRPKEKRWRDGLLLLLTPVPLALPLLLRPF